MITDSKFVMLKQFDRTLSDSVDHGQRIINAKNRRVVSADTRMAAQQRMIVALQAALAAEKAKNASLMSQIRGFLKRQ